MITPGQQDLQPLSLALAAFRRTWAERDELLRLGAIPFLPLYLLFRGLEKTQAAMYAEMQKGADVDPNVLVDAILQMTLIGLGLIVVVGFFSVNWIRQMTMGREAVPGLGLNIGTRHFHFSLAMLALVALAFGASLILSIVFTLAGMAQLALIVSMLVMVVGYLILLTRLSPAWIGIAIDARMPFSLAWQRTKGQGGRLIGALMLTALPAFAAQSVLASIFVSFGLLEAAPLAFSVLSSFISLAYMAVQLNLFVLAYPRFVSEVV
ncbi:hypothetical protein [Dongia sp.]|uniref:hypothetical protein n=1 Tax=Dongia sp. TaxID=1977262 RepID=UPI0035B4E1CE